MNETLGKIHFFFTFVCFNCVFIPLFMAGLKGNPRRIYEMSSYEFLQPVQYLHVIATIAAIGLLIGQLPFVINLVYSRVRGEKAAANPWHANTLEWATDSPPPHENFRTIPTVYRDPYEYSVPGAPGDWIPQTEPPSPIYPVSAAAD
jgi:cytochrome c oxidase subunit 1